ncbi:hypothetical protein ACPZ19_21065 [Amycolatopsis lurida]
MVIDDTLLDDASRLADVDERGLLRATAMSGAQVRATTEAAAEIGLADRLDVGRPRALVLLARPGVGRTVTNVLAALLTPTCPVPIVVCDSVPSWIGALDVVVAHTEQGDDRELAVSLERAARYGATVVLSAPPDGPVAAAVSGRGLLLTPRVPVPPELSFPRAFATGLLTANALGVLVADVETLADQLDAEAERDQPNHESFVNPAKVLALRLAGRTPLLWGLDPVAVAVAGHAAHSFAAHSAMVCDVADYHQALARPALHRAAVGSTTERDIFADPDEGGLPQPRVLLLSLRSGSGAEAARRQAEDMLAGVDVLAPAEEIDADEPTRAAVLALRFELAAVYLGLATGSIPGAGRYTSATA